MRVLAAYIREKSGGKGKVSEMTTQTTNEIMLTPEDEAILDKIWDNIDKEVKTQAKPKRASEMWSVFKQGKKFVVMKIDSRKKPVGKPLGRHPSQEKALRQIRALYANVTGDTGGKQSARGVSEAIAAPMKAPVPGMVCYPLPMGLSSDLETWTKASFGQRLDKVSIIPEGEHHVTLLYLGGLGEDSQASLDLLAAALKSYGASCAPMPYHLNGLGQFLETPHVLYMNFDCPGLTRLRSDVIGLARACGLHFDVKTHGFTPHVTLAYVEPGTTVPPLMKGQEEGTLDHLGIWVGDTHLDIPLTGTHTITEIQERGISDNLMHLCSQRLIEYSPDQPRDDKGRWTSDGGDDDTKDSPPPPKRFDNEGGQPPPKPPKRFDNEGGQKPLMPRPRGFSQGEGSDKFQRHAPDDAERGYAQAERDHRDFHLPDSRDERFMTPAQKRDALERDLKQIDDEESKSKGWRPAPPTPPLEPPKIKKDNWGSSSDDSKTRGA